MLSLWWRQSITFSPRKNLRSQRGSSNFESLTQICFSPHLVVTEWCSVYFCFYNALNYVGISFSAILIYFILICARNQHNRGKFIVSVDCVVCVTKYYVLLFRPLRNLAVKANRTRNVFLPFLKYPNSWTSPHAVCLCPSARASSTHTCWQSLVSFIRLNALQFVAQSMRYSVE